MVKEWIDTVVATAGIYVFLILMVRFFGRRMSAQLTSIDFLVLLMLGSAVETAMVHASTSFKVGIVSALTLLVLNKIITTAALKSKKFRHLVAGGPILVVHDGEYVPAGLRRAGLCPEDVLHGLRSREIDGIENVRYAVVEADGEITAVMRADTAHRTENRARATTPSGQTAL